jgi:hypothetical protein
MVTFSFDHIRFKPMSIVNLDKHQYPAQEHANRYSKAKSKIEHVEQEFCSIFIDMVLLETTFFN